MLPKATDKQTPDTVATAGKWAVGTGVIACVLACSAPMIATVTGGALFASGVAAAAFARLEVVGMAVAVLGMFALAGGFAAKMRRQTSGTSGPPPSDAASAGSCGCGPSSDDDAGVPIACTLDAKGAKKRAGEFRDVFMRAYLRSERLDDGTRWCFAAQDGLLEELRALAIQEHACCLFLEFDVEPRGEEIWWETRTTEFGEPVLEEFFRLPQTLLASRPTKERVG